VRAIIAGADWVVLPSYREGLSRVLLEAAAMGRPAVATDVPGCRDVVRDGVNGFLAPVRDAAGLAAAMARAARLDDASWQAMADAGRAMVEAEFSEQRVIALYQQALADAGVAARRASSAQVAPRRTGFVFGRPGRRRAQALREGQVRDVPLGVNAAGQDVEKARQGSENEPV
jgi:hypothetical protein